MKTLTLYIGYNPDKLDAYDFITKTRPFQKTIDNPWIVTEKVDMSEFDDTLAVVITLTDDDGSWVVIRCIGNVSR